MLTEGLAKMALGIDCGMRKMRLAGMTLAAAMIFASLAPAEVCTTQAKMQPALRDGLAGAAQMLATAVQANDTAKVRAATVAEYAKDFSASEFLIRSTSAKIAGETLAVTSIYGLDATARPANANTDAEFTCPLNGTTLEADFSIPGLPPGNYGFAMVEATNGPQPWLLSFLLRQDGGTWKMAGFYTHARTAAGHDGKWYWIEAREAAKAKQAWAAWLLYGEAYTLLRPANFLDSSHLDQLVGEQHNAAPPELSSGISKETPLVVKGSNGDEFHFTDLGTDRSDDGTRVNVVLHMRADTTDAVAERMRNEAAAAAFVKAHPEVRKDFQGVWVFAETDGQNPFMTQKKMTEIP
jgi:hypothetical protein